MHNSLTAAILNAAPGTNFSEFLAYKYSELDSGYARLASSAVNQIHLLSVSEDKSDEQLMESYRDGDLQAFDQLFTRFKDILYRYLVRQTGNTASAEEIFQDVWAALIKSRKRYVVKSKFKTYLFHIAHNKLIDYYRSKKNSRYDILSYEENNTEFSDSDETDRGLEHTTDVQHKYEHLLTLLDKLPAAQRDVFLMHEEAGMTLIEIAEVMSVSRDTIKSRLRYAIQRLRNGMRRFA